MLFEWLIDDYMIINTGKSHLIVSRNVRVRLIRITLNLKKNKCRVLTSSERYRITLFPNQLKFPSCVYATLRN